MDIVELNKWVSQDLASLNQQVAFHEKRANSTTIDEWRRKMHFETATKLRAVADHILALQAALSEALKATKPIKVGQQLSLSLDEIEFKSIDKQKLAKYASKYPGTVRNTLIHSLAFEHFAA